MSVKNIITFDNSQGDQVRGTLMKLTRTSIVMEVYNPYSIIQLSEVLERLTLTKGERILYQGRCVVNNLVNTGLVLIVSANLVDKWEDLASFQQENTIQSEVADFVAGWRNNQTLFPGYRLAVAKLRSFLHELNIWMEQVDTFNDAESLQEIEQGGDLFNSLGQAVLPCLKEMYAEFEEEASKVPPEELMNHKVYAQHDLHPLIMTSPFAHRTYSKPLGYAGDYDMVNMMAGSGLDGPTAYSKIVNYAHIKAGPAAAHRNRLDILYEYLQNVAAKAQTLGRPVRILNIGCGPAIELQRFIKNDPRAENIELYLLDFNDDTLNYTKRKMQQAQDDSGHKVSINFINESVHALLKKSPRDIDELALEDYDMVYCAGLFDYLSDRICSRLLRLFYSLVRPGGLVLATNVDPSNDVTYYMEHILEWHLIYRDEKHMLRLIPSLGNQHSYTDDTGINVFLEIKKPSID